MNSLHQQLTKFLREQGDWVSGYELENREWITLDGTVAKKSNISRRLRELAEEGVIDTMGNPVSYRYHVGKRTLSQNRALHVFFEMLATELNDAGLDQRTVLKPTVDIPWTKESVKKQLWKPIQEALYEKTSTTQLDKSQEITETHKVLMRHLAEKFGVEYIPFPENPLRGLSTDK